MAASVWMKFSKVLMPSWFAPQRADDAAGHGLPTPNGLPMAAPDPRPAACPELPSTITGSCRASIFRTARNRCPGRCRSPGHRTAAVIQDHLDLVGALDDVVVRQDQAGGDDHPLPRPRLQLGLVAEEEAEPGSRLGIPGRTARSWC